MKRYLILCTILVLGSSWTAHAKSYYVHDLDGSLIYYSVAESLVVAKFNPSLPAHHAADLALALPSLRDDTLVVAKHRGFYQFKVQSGFTSDSALAELRGEPIVECAMPVFAAQDTLLYYAYDDILIAFDQTTSQYSIDSVLEVNGLTVLSEPSSLSAGYRVLVSENSSKDAFDISNGIFEAGLCRFAHPNFHSRRLTQWQPNDQYFAYQWHLYHTEVIYGTPGVDINMREAWDHAVGDTSIVIAVIDGAFDLDHYDLDQSKMFAPRDVCGDSVGADIPDDNPRLPTNGNQSYGYYWHGTACLGIISARTDNYGGVAGMASRFRYMPIKDTDDNFDSSVEKFEQSWRWAIDNGAKVISASIGYYQWSPNVNAAIKDAYEAGIAMAVAAGNDYGAPYIGYPANLDEVLAVSATDPYDYKATYAQYGPGLDVMAPSNTISTLDVSGSTGYSPTTISCFENDYDYYCQFGGTSASAPQVAALAALILSRRPDLRCDTCSAFGVYEVIRHSSDDQICPIDPAGYDYMFGWGRINAERALLAVVRGDANNNGSVTVSDAIYIIAHIFGSGPAPMPHKLTGDANGSGGISISDAVYIIAHIFGGGPPPPVCFKY